VPRALAREMKLSEEAPPGGGDQEESRRPVRGSSCGVGLSSACEVRLRLAAACVETWSWG
jgi:hypothetical protein